MPAGSWPDRPGAGTGLPSRAVRSAGYDGFMTTVVIPPEREQRARAPAASVQLGFRLGAATLSLEVADADALRLIEDAYAPMRCPAANARAHASLRRLSDGRMHVRYGRSALRPANAVDGVPLRAAYHAAREIFARFACEPAHTLALYGGLCAVDEEAVLLLGPTTVGKTLLALHLAAQGARFLGDDTALIAYEREEAYALPRRPSLRESALPLLPDPAMSIAVESSSSMFETDRGRFWYALDAQALCGIEPTDKRYPLRAICVLGRRCDTAAMRRLDTADAVKFVTQRAYARPTSLAQVAALRRALRHTAFFEMTLADLPYSAELLLREVRSCV